MTDLRTVATVRKNSTDEIRVSVAEKGGYTLVDIRLFSPTPQSRGEPRPMRAGICILRERLPALIEALQLAHRESSR